jgi:UDP-hydrolysing UDP-N-acetyl-D-glucosamine 2-epimerase
MHLSPEFGYTLKAIEDDGFQIRERIEMLLSSDTPEGIAKSVGMGVMGFAQCFARMGPDILLVLGDRFEMYSAAVAAVPFNFPIGHIAGGSVTVGAIDDVYRHSMTKISHFHFAETETYKRRIIQMGEQPERVFVTGALGLDNMKKLSLISWEELAGRYELAPNPRPLLVTFHPVTRDHGSTEEQTGELIAALTQLGLPVVFTYPNADTNGRIIIRMIEDFAAVNEHIHVVTNLSTIDYLSFMKHASAMVGNSSSGIVEAPSFKLPVVNIGIRQQGRIMPENVINVGHLSEEISDGIRRAVSTEFQDGLRDLVNPFGDGHASERIVDALKKVPIRGDLLGKVFFDN